MTTTRQHLQALKLALKLPSVLWNEQVGLPSEVEL